VRKRGHSQNPPRRRPPRRRPPRRRPPRRRHSVLIWTVSSSQFDGALSNI
jgi:hypothetical protein